MLKKKIKTPAEKTKETNDYATDKEKKKEKRPKGNGLRDPSRPKNDISWGGDHAERKNRTWARGASPSTGYLESYGRS